VQPSSSARRLPDPRRRRRPNRAAGLGGLGAVARGRSQQRPGGEPGEQRRPEAAASSVARRQHGSAASHARGERQWRVRGKPARLFLPEEEEGYFRRFTI